MRESGARLGSLFSLLVLITPQVARAQMIDPEDGTWFRFPLPQVSPPGVHRIHASVTGEFSGDRRQDQMLLINNTPYLLLDVDTFASGRLLDRTLCGAVHDLTVLPQAGPFGVDLPAGVTDQGIFSWAYDPDRGDYVTRPLAPDILAGGRRLRCRRTAPGSVPQLVGIDASGTRVVGLEATIPAQVLFQFSLPGHPAPEILDVRSLRWASPASLDLALLLSDRVVVTNTTGDLLGSFPTTGRSVEMHVIQNHGEAHESILWTTLDPEDPEEPEEPTQSLHVLRPGGPSPALHLSVLDLEGFACIDADQDGDDDVIAISRFSNALLGLWNRSEEGTPMPFALTEEDALLATFADAGTPMGKQECPLTIADYDGDGDPDVSAAVQHTLEYFVHRNPWIPESEQRFDLPPGTSHEIEPNLVGGTNLVVDLRMPAHRPPGSTHVEASVWTEHVQLGPDYVDATPVSHSFVALGQTPGESYQLRAALPEVVTPFTSNYVVICRLVELSEQGLVLGAGPDSVLRLQGSDTFVCAICTKVASAVALPPVHLPPGQFPAPPAGSPFAQN